jgi:hypothetical protein
LPTVISRVVISAKLSSPGPEAPLEEVPANCQVETRASSVRDVTF